MERLGIKLIVAEHHGMRRFLYPLSVRIPSVYRRSAGKLALADAAGNLVPSHVSASSAENGVQCSFALSMGPLETRELYLCRLDGDRPAAIPDPLRIHAEAGVVISRQQRVAFSLDSSALLTSVVYDETEHLASPLAITLDGAPMTLDPDVTPPRLLRPPNGLYAEQTSGGVYDGGAGITIADLTCCKSWIGFRHTLSDPKPGGVLRFTLPLSVTSAMQTCDFGVGNGAYGKLQPGLVDEIVWEIDLTLKNAARYRIRSLLETGDLRTDYAGEIRREGELSSKLWLHWIEPNKAMAFAVTDIAKGCDRIIIRLTSGGLLEAQFTLGDTIANPAQFGVCYHFLNDIPPIAAATNPASILLPPRVSIVKAMI